MNITMQSIKGLTLDDMKDFLEGSRTVDFDAEGQPVYELMETVLKAQQYRKLTKGQKGTVRRFLVKVTGLSRAQTTRLIARWIETRRILSRPPVRGTFPRRYTSADIALLASVDAAHETLSGPAVRRILWREHNVFEKVGYARLADISASHIYNLRRSLIYRNHRIEVRHTQARQIAIGERRRPDPLGKPGYLRIDTVHQGHHDGKAGPYHINAVDTVTQWEVLGCVETIAENHMLPVLEAILHQFPFRIMGFHSDNGSEYINHKVAAMLEKLRVEFTKSRACRSTDNAQIEGKNGSIVRKYFSYGGLSAEHAELFQKYYTAHFNPYLNFHRPCGFATILIGKGGKRTRRYKAEDYRTPYEKFISLTEWEKHLKPGITPPLLKQQAMCKSDTEAARQMQKAKTALEIKCRRARRT